MLWNLKLFWWHTFVALMVTLLIFYRGCDYCYAIEQYTSHTRGNWSNTDHQYLLPPPSLPLLSFQCISEGWDQHTALWWLKNRVQKLSIAMQESGNENSNMPQQNFSSMMNSLVWASLEYIWPNHHEHDGAWTTSATQILRLTFAKFNIFHSIKHDISWMICKCYLTPNQCWYYSPIPRKPFASSLLSSLIACSVFLSFITLSFSCLFYITSFPIFLNSFSFISFH